MSDGIDSCAHPVSRVCLDEREGSQICLDCAKVLVSDGILECNKHLKAADLSYRAREDRHLITDITQFAMLHPAIIRSSEMRLSEIRKDNKAAHHSQAELVGLAIYQAGMKEGVDYSMREIAHIVKVPESTLFKLNKLFHCALHVDPINMVERIGVSQFQFDFSDVKSTRDILTSFPLEQIQSLNPLTAIAAAIYFHLRRRARKMTLSAIASGCGVHKKSLSTLLLSLRRNGFMEGATRLAAARERARVDGIYKERNCALNLHFSSEESQTKMPAINNASPSHSASYPTSHSIYSTPPPPPPPPPPHFGEMNNEEEIFQQSQAFLLPPIAREQEEEAGSSSLMRSASTSSLDDGGHKIISFAPSKNIKGGEEDLRKESYMLADNLFFKVINDPFYFNELRAALVKKYKMRGSAESKDLCISLPFSSLGFVVIAALAIMKKKDSDLISDLLDTHELWDVFSPAQLQVIHHQSNALLGKKRKIASKKSIAHSF